MDGGDIVGKLSYLMDVEEVSKELDISRGYAYKLIREMNTELKDLGYFTVSGKVPRAYFATRFFRIDAMDNDNNE